MILCVVYLIFSLYGVVADRSDDCSLKCLSKFPPDSDLSSAYPRAREDSSHIVDPEPKPLTCENAVKLVRCINRCQMIMYTNATCSALIVLDFAIRGVCPGFNVDEDYQRKIWQHVGNFSAEWARTRQDSCPTTVNQTLEETCEIVCNCTFGESLRAAQLESLPSPHTVQWVVGAYKLDLHSRLHSEHGMTAQQALPASCELLSQMPPAPHYPDSTDPPATDADQCALQCIYPTSENLLGGTYAASSSVTPLTSCNASAEFVACLRRCPRNKAIDTVVTRSHYLHWMLCSPPVVEEVQEEFWKQSLEFADNWFKLRERSPLCANCSADEICTNMRSFTFGTALQDAQRVTFASPVAIQYQVFLVRLILYTQCHLQFGELPPSCDFLKENLATEEKWVDECRIWPPLASRGISGLTR